MSYTDIPGRYAMSWILRDALERTRKGGVWVEIGVALGRGIAEMARTLIDAGRDDVSLFAVDPWSGTARNGEQQASAPASDHGDWALFLDTMQAHATEELRRIHIVRAPSIEAAAMFSDGDCDLVILDAGHDYDDVMGDLAAWIDNVSTGGTIAGDDCHEEEFPGVPRALREFFGEGFEVRRDEKWNWPTWRKTFTSVAAGKR